MKYLAAVAVLLCAAGMANSADPSVAFRSIEVQGEKITLTDRQYEESGKLVSCQQYLQSYQKDTATGKTTFELGEICQSGERS